MDAARMDRLIELPSELIHSISEFAGLIDRVLLLHLRLACRQLQKCADDAFLDTFFTSRWHLYTDHSLPLLLEISQDERFRRRLSRLTIHTPAAPLFSLEDHAFRCHGLGALCSPKRNTAWASTKDGDFLWRDWEERAYDIEEDCSAILEASLVELKLAGVIPSLAAAGYTDYRSQVGIPYGLTTAKRALRNMCDYSSSFRNRSDNAAVSRMLVAIVRADFPVAELNIRGPNMDAPCEPVAFAPMVAALNFPWNNLVKLSTAVHSGNLCCTDAWADAWSPLQNWLASLRSLQTLAINFEVQETNLDWYDDILYDVGKWNRLAACLGHAPLFSLMLGVGHMPYAGLILLLESLKTRLRHLIISNARLLDYESNDDLIWPRAFQCIADSLRLEHLEFHEFSHEDDSHMATLDDTSPFVANGTPKSVRASLEHFIATVKFEYDGAGPQRDDAPWHAPAKAETEACTSVPHTDVDNEHEVYSEYGDEDDYGASFDDFDVQAIDFLVSQRCDDRYAQGSETEREGTN